MIRTDSSEGSTVESTICVINTDEKDWSTVCCCNNCYCLFLIIGVDLFLIMNITTLIQDRKMICTCLRYLGQYIRKGSLLGH